MENKRNEIIDFYKGFLMWGVILGHLITALKGGLHVGPVFIHTFIRTYDMPFFMILSGFFLSKSLARHSIKNVLVNRATMILCPIVLWNVISANFHFTSFYFLWAVFVSSIICIFSYAIERMVDGERFHLELIIEVLCIVVLHIINVPWNLFYLYPFFIFGRYLRNIDFKLSHFLFTFVLFVFTLCFWKGGYSPWIIGAEAWRSDLINIVIYLYRFLLGVLGTYIVANVLKYLYVTNSFGGGKMLMKVGSQTLGIYILQSLVVEMFLGRIMRYLVNVTGFNYNDSAVNVMGYIIAPILSFYILVVLSRIIEETKQNRYLKFLFGFKIAL